MPPQAEASGPPPDGGPSETAPAPAEESGASETMALPPVDPATDQEPEAPADAPKAEGPAAAAAAAPVGKDRLGCDFSKSCRQLTLTGIVLGSLSLASLAAGIVLYARPDEDIPDEPAYSMSTQPPGLVAMTLGGGVAVTSILMLVAAHRGYKQTDSADGKSAWRPVWGPRRAAMDFGTRLRVQHPRGLQLQGANR